MKLVFVINSLGSGGAERVVSLLTSELARRGHEVFVLLRQNSQREARYALPVNVRVVDLHAPWDELKAAFPDLGVESQILRFLESSTPRQIARRAAGLRQRLRLRHLVEVLNPNAVLAFMVTTNIETASALRGSRFPVIVSERSDPGRFDGNWIKRYLRNKWYRRADGLVFQTQDALEFFFPAIRKKSTVIFNPLELPGLVRTVETGPPRIVTVGRLVPSKRFDQVIEAVGRLNASGIACLLEIYGEGPEKGVLEALISRLSLEDRVFLKGFSTSVLEDIKDAAVFILASTYEGMPNALLEAMGLGVPSVSSDCPIGGPRAVIRSGENGLLFPVGDLDALTDALRVFVTDREGAEQMGRRAMALRQDLSLDKIADQWEGWIATVIERKILERKE